MMKQMLKYLTYSMGFSTGYIHSDSGKLSLFIVHKKQLHM